MMPQFFAVMWHCYVNVMMAHMGFVDVGTDSDGVAGREAGGRDHGPAGDPFAVPGARPSRD